MTTQPKTSIDIVRVPGNVPMSIPQGVELDEVIKALVRLRDDENANASVDRTFKALPLEGAFALTKAVSATFGWTSMVPTPTFFGDNPPRLIKIRVSRDETVEVPWGRIVLPGVRGYINTSVSLSHNTPVFRVNGVVKRGDLHKIDALLEMAERFIADSSIYKGRALEISFPDDIEDASPLDFEPTYMDLGKAVRVEDLILNDHIKAQIAASIFDRVQKTSVFRRHTKIRRGVLLAGDYGTGKTLAAKTAAGLCEKHGWTFLYVKNIKSLPACISIARRLAPAVLFVEDIDQRLGTDARDADVNDVLNTLDGIDGKSDEVIYVFSTNHIESINAAFLRPGRVDEIVFMERPDRSSIKKLCKLYCKQLDPQTNLDEVADLLFGQTAAIVGEACERALNFAIARIPADNPNAAIVVTGDDLAHAAHGMKYQIGLATPKMPDKRSDIEKAAAVIAAGFSAKEPTSAQGKPFSGDTEKLSQLGFPMTE